VKRLLTGLLMVLFIVGAATAPAFANWSDYFEAPVIVGPGTDKAPGQVVDTLTPELQYNGVGQRTDVLIYDDSAGTLTLAEQVSKRPGPILVCRVQGSSLKVPAGVLLPGHNYHWCVESTYAPGSKSECTKSSTLLYFSAARDAK